MSYPKDLSTAGIIGFTVIAPLCLAIRQVQEALEFLGLTAPAAEGLSVALLVVCLAFSLVGILSGYRDHRCRWPGIVGISSAAPILFFAITGWSALGGYLSCAGLITAGIGNIILRRRGLPRDRREFQFVSTSTEVDVPMRTFPHGK